MKMKKRTRSPEKTKEKLLISARSLFASYGFHGTSVEKIARKAGVNISMISHHFGGKEGVYRACLQGFGQARIEALDRFMEPPASAEEFRVRLEMLVNELLLFHLKRPEVTAILLHDVSAQRFWGKELQETLFSFTTKLAGYFEEAKKRGLLKPDVEPMIVASLVYLSFSGLIQVSTEVERVLKVSLLDDAYRKEIIRQTLDVVWGGIVG